ncbi:MAG TPA: hypothetical protein G4O00_00995 [Thermoflexia bacterium]|jgi:hypothetical protein|nr:hypothetical protein [Thermoflexia bacterium]
MTPVEKEVARRPKKRSTKGSVKSKKKSVPLSAVERMKRRETRRKERRAYVAAAPAVGAATEEAKSQLESLSWKLERLQEAASLSDIYDDLADIEAMLTTLPAEIETLRSRGYVFRNYLERKVEVLSKQWADMQDRVRREVERRGAELSRALRDAERAVQQAASGDPARIARAESVVRTLEGKVSAAQDALEAMFDTLDQNVTQTRAQVEEIEWALEQADQASFDFYPDENLVAACRAQFLETKKEGPEGILFLTDGRLIFERKEEVATKKILFITTEKKTVQELIFQVPIGHIEEVKASQSGFLGRKEMLEVLFAPEADISEARLRLLGGADNEEWAALIGRVRSGDIEKERVQVEGEEAAEAEPVAPAEVPTKCPNCGAILTTPIVKGMREITCEYCGTVIRL